jgi:hypothetical protein
VEQLTRGGLSPQEAERQARIAFGNLALVEERTIPKRQRMHSRRSTRALWRCEKRFRLHGVSQY